MSVRNSSQFGGEAGVCNRYQVNASGQSNVGVRWPLVSLLVSSDSADSAAAAEELAVAPARLAAALAEIEALRAKVPPTRPTRILGKGCVRQDPQDGEKLWLLNTAEKGWSAFGIQLDGWDDLFRRWDLVVGECRHDQHGTFWVVSPRAKLEGAQP